VLSRSRPPRPRSRRPGVSEAIRKLAHRRLSLRERTPFRGAKGDTLRPRIMSDRMCIFLVQRERIGGHARCRASGIGTINKPADSSIENRFSRHEIRPKTREIDSPECAQEVGIGQGAKAKCKFEESASGERGVRSGGGARTPRLHAPRGGLRATRTKVHATGAPRGEA
jgi:hypothetical protein